MTENNSNIPQAPQGHVPPFGFTPPQPQQPQQDFTQYSWLQNAPTPTPPKKSRRGWIIAGSAVAAVLLVSIAGANGAARTAADPAPVVTAAAPTAEPTQTYTPKPTETSDPETYVPSKDDVTLTIKQTRKKCYGYGIGCNVSIKVNGAIDFDATPDEGTLTVYYTIKGDEDGPIEDMMDFDLSEGTYYPNTEIIGTRSKGTKITVQVTDLEYSEY